jgi:hypothetical protein
MDERDQGEGVPRTVGRHEHLLGAIVRRGLEEMTKKKKIEEEEKEERK